MNVYGSMKGRSWKELVATYFKVLSQHLPGETEKINDEISGQVISGPRFEPETLRIGSRIIKPLQDDVLWRKIPFVSRVN
jgi:hypothetical protein